jgi:hypothetical protein
MDTSVRPWFLSLREGIVEMSTEEIYIDGETKTTVWYAVH